jgi:hypothetical protein
VAREGLGLCGEETIESCLERVGVGLAVNADLATPEGEFADAVHGKGMAFQSAFHGDTSVILLLEEIKDFSRETLVGACQDSGSVSWFSLMIVAQR